VHPGGVTKIVSGRKELLNLNAVAVDLGEIGIARFGQPLPAEVLRRLGRCRLKLYSRPTRR
jgi:hypothetical protein